MQGSNALVQSYPSRGRRGNKNLSQAEVISPVNLATKEIPLPTALADSCLTVNGVPIPMLFVSSTLINAQLPFNVDGNATMVLRTPGGVSETGPLEG